MSFPPKLVSVMAVVQLLFILLGFLVTRGFLGIFTKMHPELDYHRFARGMLIFAGDYGLWFFLFPLGWCVVAAFNGDVNGEEASVTMPTIVSGVVLMALLAAFFTFTSLWAMALCAAGPIQVLR